MKKIVLLLIPLCIIACKKDDDSSGQGSNFTLSETRLDFDSNAGSKSLGLIDAVGEVGVTVTEGNGWCQAQVSGTSLTVSVQENTLTSSRTAKIQVTNGDKSIEVTVNQAQKVSSLVAAVTNVTAIPGWGEITLKWENPEEANFSHVIVRYEIQGVSHEIPVDENLTEYTVEELLSSNGEHVFTIQSVGKDDEPGAEVTVRATPYTLVEFRFEKQLEFQFLPYYLRTSDTYTLSVGVGSSEYDANLSVTLQFETDAPALDLYNQENEASVDLMPASAYSLPEDFQFTGTEDFQDLDIQVNISALQDGKTYGLPLKIKPPTEETMGSIILIFHVDDLAGWYTVERLENSGEEEDAYYSSDSRRYIKRTGEYTWETGYLFQAYSESESDGESYSADEEFQYNVQLISIDPDTKAIFIQQGDYAVSESKNSFDIGKNELHIEYLYRDWDGWWTHERMYDRSLDR
ncbi:MAG: DUF1735 domain-containing protein [Prevotellaceae bacterium]|jgi:hypothetical protein|nr:DUF1735 domain-containing protein [Prevotellaceae bacterium]